MRVIWSMGQIYPDYNHNPGSGIEARTAMNRMFYKPDEIKYHGSVNRGATTLNFFGKERGRKGGREGGREGGRGGWLLSNACKYFEVFTCSCYYIT